MFERKANLSGFGGEHLRRRSAIHQTTAFETKNLGLEQERFFDVVRYGKDGNRARCYGRA